MRRSFRLKGDILKLFKMFYLPQPSAVYIFDLAVIEPEERGFGCGSSVWGMGLSTIFLMLYSDTFLWGL